MNPIIEVLYRNLDSLRYYNIQKLAIFGSYARNEESEDSDIDVLVAFKEGYATFRNFMGLKQYLESLLQKEVDLVSEKAVKSELLPHILRDAIYLEGL
ncbi:MULTISPECIES: nucleotidyltransferase family protein [Bacillaceae]|uniref:nucleotidyltransferase family protein n=1 Tax=Bacillaceae TaxID=186817 RepID=UPI0015605DEA|nr:nucleotidyltransferase family protein [Niallia circulans]NRG28115.1 nucleotidyltransferase family protein [Niallia circulans]